MSLEAPADGAALLREHGLHVTAQRLAVLRAMSARPHSTADDVYRLVRSEIGAVSPPRVCSVGSSPPFHRPATRTGSATTITTSSAEPAAGPSMSIVRWVMPPV